MYNLILVLCILAQTALSHNSNLEWKRLRVSGTEPNLAGGASLTQVGSDLFYTHGLNEPFFGRPNVFFNTTYKFNPASGQWAKLNTVNPPTNRALHCTFSAGSKLYLFGGAEFQTVSPFFRFYNDLYELDLGTNVWTVIPQSGDIPSARASASCIRDNGKKLYLVGGGAAIAQENDVRVLDLVTFTWTLLSATNRTSTFPTTRVGAAIGFSKSRNSLFWTTGENAKFQNGALVATQLNDVWEFSLTTKTWTQIPQTNPWIPLISDVAYTSDENNLYIYGGDLVYNLTCCSNFGTLPTDAFWIFNFRSRTFRLVHQGRFGAPPSKRGNLALFKSNNRDLNGIYSVGGYDYDTLAQVGSKYSYGTYFTDINSDDDDD